MKSVVSLSWMRCTPGRVVLYASKLAAVAGMHPYVSREELRAEYMQEDTDADDAAQEIERLPEEARAVVREAMTTSFADAGEVQAAYQNVVRTVAPSEVVAEAVRTAMYTQHGTEQEERIRSALPQKLNVCLKFRVSASPIAEGIFVGGKHDGMVDMADTADMAEGSGEIVEIKTRQRRFLGAPLYERIQVHAYMFIFGTRRARLIESYMGKRREHAIEFDDALWEQVVREATDFVNSILLTSPSSLREQTASPRAPLAALAAPCQNDTLA